jgi:hypothetical protein
LKPSETPWSRKARSRRLLTVFLDEVNFIARRAFLLEILSVLPVGLKMNKLTDAFFAAAEKTPGVVFDARFVSACGYELHQLRRKA